MKKNAAGVIYRLIGTFYFLFFISMFLTIPVSAYIDPATTAMLTQIIAGVFITLGVVFGVFRRKIILFFKNKSVNRLKRKIEKQAEKQQEEKQNIEKQQVEAQQEEKQQAEAQQEEKQQVTGQ